MDQLEKFVSDAEAVQVHPLCGQTVKLASITEHVSLEQAKHITLYDVVTRPGFVRVTPRLERDCQMMILIQSVEQM